jgi:hypothetical protein
MAGHVVIRITERLGGGEPLRTAYAVAEANQHRAVALFKLRPDHTADEQVEAVVEHTQTALDSVVCKVIDQRRLRRSDPNDSRMEHPGHHFRFRGKTSNRAEFPCIRIG